MEAIAAICKVPMIRNGNSRINIGNMVKMTAQSGNAAVPVTIAARCAVPRTIKNAIDTNRMDP